MSDQTPPPDLQSVEADVRSAHEQTKQLSAILREALAADERLAGEQGGDGR